MEGSYFDDSCVLANKIPTNGLLMRKSFVMLFAFLAKRFSGEFCDVSKLTQSKLFKAFYTLYSRVTSSKRFTSSYDRKKVSLFLSSVGFLSFLFISFDWQTCFQHVRQYRLSACSLVSRIRNALSAFFLCGQSKPM